MPNDDEALVRSGYPTPEMTPAEFESFVYSEFQQAHKHVEDLRITLHETIDGIDGEYDFDVTVRFSVGGVKYLTIVEAKRHKNPIKREVAQILHSKIQSVGAHKGVIVSTAPFQRGALVYALTHGIALVQVTEGRLTIHAAGRDAYHRSPPSHDTPSEFGIPRFVGHCYAPTNPPTEASYSMTLTSGRPKSAATLLLGISDEPA